MKILGAVLALITVIASASAHATPCDQVQAGIDARIKANGVKSYTLDVVPVSEIKDQKVVGSCEGGSKKIVYTRTPAPAKPVTDVAASAKS